MDEIAAIVFFTFLGVFAVIGLYITAKTLLELVMPTKQIGVSIQINDARDIDSIDIMISDAKRTLIRKGGARIDVLISSELAPDGRIDPFTLGILENYGVNWHIVS